MHKKWILAAVNIKHAANDSWFPIISVNNNISRLTSGSKWPLFSNPLTFVTSRMNGRSRATPIRLTTLTLFQTLWICHWQPFNTNRKTRTHILTSSRPREWPWSWGRCWAGAAPCREESEVRLLLPSLLPDYEKMVSTHAAMRVMTRMLLESRDLRRFHTQNLLHSCWYITNVTI